ncbi:MAG: hypothetical protein ACRESZ_14815 [Methylococcales bacterium]
MPNEAKVSAMPHLQFAAIAWTVEAFVEAGLNQPWKALPGLFGPVDRDLITFNQIRFIP